MRWATESGNAPDREEWIRRHPELADGLKSFFADHDQMKAAAYLRLVDADKSQDWDSRGHFFAAAAEAMRRILVDNARRKASLKHGGDLDRIDLPEIAQSPEDKPIDLLALDEALIGLEQTHPENAQIIKLRFFAGMSLEDAAQAMGISRNCPAQMGLRSRLAVRPVARIALRKKS